MRCRHSVPLRSGPLPAPSPRRRRASGSPRGSRPSSSCPRRSGRGGRRPRPRESRSRFREPPRRHGMPSSGRRPIPLPSQLDDGHARRREAWFLFAAQRGRDAPAVRLVADHDDVLAAARDRLAQRLRRRAGSESLIRLRNCSRRAASASPVSRARKSGLVSTMSGTTPSSRIRSPSSRACSRPSSLSGRSSSGSPGVASACRTR